MQHIFHQEKLQRQKPTRNWSALPISCFEKNLQSLQQFTELIDIEAFDLNAAVEFGKIQSELKQIGRPTGELDALIAAVARSRDDIIVTNNIKDFENIPNMKLENWL